MWPRVPVPGTETTIASYHLLNFGGWLMFLFAGTLLTWRQSGFFRHWWWLFLGMIVACLGSNMIARLRDGGLGMTPWGRPWTSGYFGGPLLFLAWTGGYVLIHRISAYPFLDAFAIAFSLSRAVSKLGCFAAGCCAGRPTDSVLGIAFTALGDPIRRHPTQLYEAAFHLLTALVLGWFYARGWLRGRLVMLLGASYGAGRWLVEPLRDSHPARFLDGPLTVKQLASLLIVVFCVTYLGLDWLGIRRSRARAEWVPD